MFVAKYILPGKITVIQPNYNDNVYSGVAEKTFKDSATYQILYPWRLRRIDTKFSKEYREIKRSKFIPKVARSIVKECPPYNLSKMKYYLFLNETLEINLLTETNHWTKNRS